MTVICSVFSTSDIAFRSFKDKEEISSVQDLRIKNDADFSVLVIEPVNVNSSGNYSCLARDNSGEASYSSYLQVEGKYYYKN